MLPRPDDTVPHLADVVPSVLAAMGARGFDSYLELPGDRAGACVLLIDGLGAELLDAHAEDAPVLSELRGHDRRDLHVGFPATTAAGLAAIGTGCRSGEHGMVGYTFHLPGAGVINALRWRPHPVSGADEDLRADYPPERMQPKPTTFQQAESAGVTVNVISGAEFTGSGLTRAVLRGGQYIGVHALGDLAAEVRTTILGGGFCYGYHGQLDMLGHLHGPGSLPWRMQLRQVDQLVESIVESLPPGGLLAVVADHGMVTVDDLVDIDEDDLLTSGVRAIGGEARARHVYVEHGAEEDVLATWQEKLGERAWVVSKDEAVEAGWFGDLVEDYVVDRIGDVIAAARGGTAIIRRSHEPMESMLIGHHGSLSTAEQLVPLVLAHR
ncbi:alkaline phosphatase family protein [Thermocrispum municipale]|uniref:alkaline phosphatase family protein n=1 Tax=Thermocrispum municipale TaxID=37926 RepID=UPI0003FD4442|nr:nucleotide pyrophosphatase/phosphodiesterase family protein [Thermocrispum municipale]